MTSLGNGSILQRQQQMSSSFKSSSFDPKQNSKNVREAEARTSTHRETISIKLDEAVGSITISPSGRDVCLGGRRGLFIVDLDDIFATPRFLPHYSDIVADVQWSPHSTRAHWVVSTSGPKALVWNLAATPTSGASAIEHVCLGHERSITDINWAVFQYDTLATCGIDGNVLCYDLRLGGRRPTIRYSGWRYGATQVKYNRQSANLLASSHGEWVYIWDDRKGSSPVTTIQAHKQKIYGIDWSRKTRDDIVTCSLDSTVKLWHLDGAQQAEAPTQTINTASPVWRARFTPFGNGIVTLPQRSKTSVQLWSPSSPEAPIETLVSSHTDVVREFLWRSRGGNDIRDDDREFQLVTWGSDKQLLMTPVPHSITSLVGHVPHSPIEVRQTRRNAENRSFRDPTVQPSDSSNLSISLGTSQNGGKSVSPTDKAASSSFGLNSSSSPVEHKMTPPSALSARVPLSTATASRYGRSSHSNTTTGSASSTGSPQFGTSPADPKSPYLHSDYASSRRKGISVVKSSANLSQMNPATAARSSVLGLKRPAGLAQGNQSFMTRAAPGRGRAGGHDTVSWMENVRIVSGQNGEEKDEQQHGTDATSTIGDRESVPLHEEITSVARAFESRVRFEKINIPSRTVVVALHGPWAISGLSVFLRATFHFPSDYPQVALSIDIERSSSIGDKGRARILTVVRSLAARYAVKRCNSLEAVLICLTSGKLHEPISYDDVEGYPHEDIQNSSVASELLVGNLNVDEEDEDVDDEKDLERFLANRNCPAPRRCGAVFGPTGQLFTFFPLDPLHHHAATVEKRQRSRSPSRDRKQRNQRRRLFESFGVIPSLQIRPTPESGYEEAIEDDQEEDSDEILNMPSLLMAQRRRSRGRTDSVGTSQHPRLAGTGRAFNSRIYGQDCSSIIGIDLSLSATYKLEGNLSSIIKANAHMSNTENGAPTAWLVRRAWETLSRLSQTVERKNANNHMPLFLGDRLPEQVIIDLLEMFNCLGDVQMLGILACLIELDRRVFRSLKPQTPRRSMRSPPQSTGTDYFSIKPSRSDRSNENVPRHSATTPSAPGAPFKSPKDWLMSSSYGTQASSGGSSTRGSSWANNLSTFFKSATGDKSTAGRSTPPAGDNAKPPSASSLSPAFIKRAAIEPLKEIRKAGGIASGRPANNRGASNSKLKGTSHVSFAATAAEQRAPSPTVSVKSKANASRFKVVIKHVTSPDSLAYTSILLGAPMQAQLEYYRLMYAELLHRIDLPQQRTQVLQLTRASVDGAFKPFMHTLSGIGQPKETNLSLESACPTCGSLLVMEKGSAPQCGACKKRQKPLPCSICHFPLDGLVETCLACLHSSHLACLLEWRQDEVCCPAACGCECANVQEEDRTQVVDVLASFKSPLLFT